MGRGAPTSRKAKGSAAGDDWQAPRFAGLTFVFTDGLKQFQSELETPRVEAEGGCVVADVGPRVNYVVIGEWCKKRAALKRQIAEINRTSGASVAALREADFLEMFTPGREQALAMLRAGEAGRRRWQELCRYPTELVKLDLSGADLHGLSLRELYFGSAKLRGADLSQADLHGAWFRGTDLSGADLRQADLTGANFEAAKLGRARVEGAAFELAKFWQTEFTRKQWAHGGRLGPAVLHLEGADSRMESLEISGQIEWGRQEIKFTLRSQRPPYNCSIVWSTTGHFRQGYAKSLVGGFLILANTWGRGRPRLDTLTIKRKGGTLKGRALPEAVRAAVREVFGL